MTPEGQKQLIEAVAQYQTTIASLLTKGVTKSHIDGGVIGRKKLSMGISFDLVKQEAVDYGTQYKDDLINKGGSYVYDLQTRQTVFKPWMADHADATKSSLADAINNGILQGKSMDDLADDIAGVTGKEQDWCMKVARTETDRAQWAGSKAQYEDSGVVDGVTLSNGPNPCPECESRHGEFYTLEDAEPLPLHPDCSCDYIPHLKGDDE